IPFFYFNMFGDVNRGRKIFMGDTGSQTIGLVLAVLAIQLSNVDPTLAHPIHSPIIIAFSLLFTPAIDVVRVVMHRAVHGKHLFKPDRNHIHHKFLALGFSHHAAMLTILSLSAGFVLLNLLMVYVLHANINIILFTDIALWTAFNIGLSKQIKGVKK
ncbi:MAG: undecaprenyl/decaprenyl-phosphate alpha-N-acetylglucosaminyl 1-phosphate transferase, partial [Bacteroidaceae bacterium]